MIGASRLSSLLCSLSSSSIFAIATKRSGALVATTSTAFFHSTSIVPKKGPSTIHEKIAQDPARNALSSKMKGERMIDWTVERDESSWMPTLESHKEIIDGVPYEELPICYIKATKNNTLIHFYTYDHQLITNTSCRKEGFQNARKKTEVAAQATGIAAGQRALRRGLTTVRVQVKGIGPGRMAAPKGMSLAGLRIASVTDFTPMPEYFPRMKKQRRI